MNRWKEASSLIITAASKNQIALKTPVSKLAESDRSNFEILALKKRSTRKPQLCVFPGGSVSVADSVQEWEGLFSKFGFNLNVLSDSLATSNILKLPIFNDRNELLPRWLSLRITAIRETFEECGILICKSKQANITPLPQSSSIQDFSTNHFEVDNIESWRSKVLDDPFQFLSLCEHFDCYPDVQNLFLWSNWLTPSHMTERFDAVFFFTNMNHLTLYRGSPDNKEIESSEWFTPEELLDLSNKGEIWLKPPQWYEIRELMRVKQFNCLFQWFTPEELLDLSDKGEIWLKPPQWYEIRELMRMKQFNCLFQWFTPEELLDLSDKGEIWLKPPQWYEIRELMRVKQFNNLYKYSYQRASSCLRWMPVRIIALDGEISLLPGDEMYPNEIYLFKSSPIVRKEKTMASLRCEKMHRMEHTGDKIVLFDTGSD